MNIMASFQPFSALATLVVLCASLQNAPTVVNAQSYTSTPTTTYFPVFNLNNGVVSSTMTCTSIEWSRIQTIVGDAITKTSTGRERELLRSPNPNNRRNLAFKCSDCGGKPLCLATIGRGCALLGKRRRLLNENEQQPQSDETQAMTNEQRSLQTTSPCAGQIAAVDAALKKAKSSLLAPCQALLNAPRLVQCAQYTYDCNIYGFTVVHPFREVVVTSLNMTNTCNNSTVTSFCASVGPVAIRADTNFFLGSVTITVTGKRSADGTSFPTTTRVEGYQPYMSFGKIRFTPAQLATSTVMLPGIPAKAIQPYVPLIIGQTLSPGEYTVSAYSQDDPASGQNTTFVVKNC